MNQEQKWNNQLENSKTDFEWCVNFHERNNPTKSQEPDEFQNTKQLNCEGIARLFDIRFIDNNEIIKRNGSKHIDWETSWIDVI